MLFILGIIAAHLLGGDSSFYGWAQSHESLTVGNFRNSTAMSIDPRGNVFVLDAATNELLMYSSAGIFVTKTGGYGWLSTNFDSPTDVCSPNGIDIYVADYGNHRIQRFDKQLNYVSTFDLRSDDNSKFRLGYPLSVGVDRFGALFVLEGENKQIVKINTRQHIERIFGGVDAGKGRLVNPKKIQVSSSDKLYVLDDTTFKVFDIFGNFLAELRNDSLRNILSFAVRDDTLYVLQPCVVFTMKGNAVLNRFLVSCDVVDVALTGDSFVFLTKKNYYYERYVSLIH